MKYNISGVGKFLFSKKGFTLTEVLIATAIVGIIAALVLPALVTHFRDEVLAHQMRRQMTSIKSAIDNLVVTENKSNFGQTMMYSDSATPDYDTTSGEFIKKYLRVSKYYGAFSKNKNAILKECFANKYYEFSGNDKKDYSIENILNGACAKLKNGASICLTPQRGQNAISGVIDLNGPKGPNVYGKDLMIIDGNEIAPVTFTAYDPSGEGTSSVATTDKPNITPDPDNPCEIGDYGNDCCRYYLNKGLITSSDHECCNNSTIAPLVPACAKEIEIQVNLYPETCKLGDSDCTPYANAYNTTAQKKDGNDMNLTFNPPDIYLYCEGEYVGYMPASTLKSAINSRDSSGKYYFNLHITSKNRGKVCGYHDANHSYGIRPNYSSVTFTQGYSKNFDYGGYKWSIQYY